MGLLCRYLYVCVYMFYSNYTITRRKKQYGREITLQKSRKIMHCTKRKRAKAKSMHPKNYLLNYEKLLLHSVTSRNRVGFMNNLIMAEITNIRMAMVDFFIGVVIQLGTGVVISSQVGLLYDLIS